MWRLLIPVIAWGGNNLFMKWALENLDVGSVMSWSLAGQFFALVFLMLFFVGPPSVDSAASAWAFLGGAVGLVGGYFFLEVLATKKLSVVAPFMSPFGMMFTIVLAVAVLREYTQWNIFHIIGICCALMSVVALTLAESK